MSEGACTCQREHWAPPNKTWSCHNPFHFSTPSGLGACTHTQPACFSSCGPRIRTLIGHVGSCCRTLHPVREYTILQNRSWDEPGHNALCCHCAPGSSLRLEFLKEMLRDLDLTFLKFPQKALFLGQPHGLVVKGAKSHRAKLWFKSHLWRLENMPEPCLCAPNPNRKKGLQHTTAHWEWLPPLRSAYHVPHGN